MPLASACLSLSTTASKRRFTRHTDSSGCGYRRRSTTTAPTSSDWPPRLPPASATTTDSALRPSECGLAQGIPSEVEGCGLCRLGDLCENNPAVFVTGIIAAGGRGERLGGLVPKQ